MLTDVQDTIVALSSAQGSGARAIVRLSGPDAWRIAGAVIFEPPRDRPARRLLLTTSLLPFANPARALPGDVYFWPAPRTYTGQDIVELHTISSPPLVDLLIARLLSAGARAAQRGEFTLRAFLAGKLDLTQAEAVLGVIEAHDRAELLSALKLLAGGMSRPLQELREDLLNLLADVEAGLDFSDEDIQFVAQKEMLDRLARALAQITLVRRQIEQRAVGPRPFRVLLAGPPNAGKSSLFNALVGKRAALVSPTPGTTRDYLEENIHTGGVTIALVDMAGLRCAADTIEHAAQQLGREQVEHADLVLWCEEAAAATGDWAAWLPPLDAARLLKVATKCDLQSSSTAREQVKTRSAEWLATSATTGQGLAELTQALVQKARARKQAALAPSLSRCRHHVDACLTHLRTAHGQVLHGDPPELLALELRLALEELGAMVGAVYTDDLLDRIFSRFCIGK